MRDIGIKVMKLIENVDKTSTKYKQYIMKKGALIKIVTFLVMIVAGAFISLMIPLRPEESVTEKRKQQLSTVFGWRFSGWYIFFRDRHMVF